MSNDKFTCRPPAVAAGNLSNFIVYLPDDCDIVLGVCGHSSVDQQPIQFDKRRQIDLGTPTVIPAQATGSSIQPAIETTTPVGPYNFRN
ncbi:MAG: hypothetical protein ABL996_06735 [Micropepsaceae bacterium]